jgi:PKD repeat protein
VLSKFFIKAGATSSSANNITAWQYWFDNQYTSVITTPITPSGTFNLNSNIDASALSDGLHTIHFRFQDELGAWSSVLSRFVIKAGSGATAGTHQITEWQYWFDMNYAGASSTIIPASAVFDLTAAIDANSLNNGLHTIHIRFKDNMGQWSSAVSRFIIKSASGTTVSNQIEEFQYWFDQGYLSAVTTAIAPTEVFNLNQAIDANSLSNGLHTVHFRFRDALGQWSSVVSRFVIKNSSGSSVSNEINAFEYWFDQDYPGAVQIALTPGQVIQLNQNINASALSNGLHTIHVRFKDTQEQWSSVVSRFVIKNTATAAANNVVTSYRYWFDEADSDITTRQLSGPTEIYNLNTSISLAHLPKGDHRIHFQFKDTLQQWSSVLTDTINKLPLPVALFNGDTLMFCDTGTVHFTDESIDAETWLWTFGDGNTSTDQHPAHFYATPGIYDVSLQITDIGSSLDSTLSYTAYVGVYNTPDPTIALSDNDSICEGQTIDLSVLPGSYVLWNTGNTSNTIVTDTSGTFIATLSNPLMGVCSSSDTATITVISVPLVNLGSDTSICTGESLTLYAGMADSYQWSNSATSPSITVSGAGTYSVSAYNILGCAGTDDITVILAPLAVANFSASITAFNVAFTDASTAATSWDWFFDDGNTSTVQNPVNTFAADGTYHVCLTVSNDCNSDTFCQDIFINASGIQNQNISLPVMALYPNPAVHETTLLITGNETEELEMNLYDMTGKMVLSQQVYSNAANTINIEKLSTGEYFCIVNYHGAIVKIKLMITH